MCHITDYYMFSLSLLCLFNFHRNGCFWKLLFFYLFWKEFISKKEISEFILCSKLFELVIFKKRMNGICQLYLLFFFIFSTCPTHPSIYWSYFKHLANLFHSINNLYTKVVEKKLGKLLRNMNELYCYFEFATWYKNYRLVVLHSVFSSFGVHHEWMKYLSENLNALQTHCSNT